ncbi:MAG: arginase [Schleiferiaceae bacterium]
MIEFISVMSELGAGTRGSSLGLEAMKMASYKEENPFFETFTLHTVSTRNEDLAKEVVKPAGKRITGIAHMYQAIAESVSKVAGSSSFPFVLSGDHSNAGGTMAGLKKAFPDKRMGVIWVDAHADLHSPFTSPSGNVHGMPVATALSEDNLECKINDPKPETLEAWNSMKGDSQRLLHSDVVFIAVRDTEHPENEIMRRNNIPNYTVDQVREEGASQIAQKALEYLAECDLIYVSFDVDSMDPSVSVGTGTPVPHGLTPEEATDILNVFAASPKLACMECTEINPLLDDKGNAMAETSLAILKNVSNTLIQNGK